MTQLRMRNVPLEKLARLIRRLDRRQKAALLRLVPELQTIHPYEPALPSGQKDLLSYFDTKIAALSSTPPLDDNDLFLGGLSVAEFFAASEAEQARLWDAAHKEALQTLDDYEHSIRSDAMPTR